MTRRRDGKPHEADEAELRAQWEREQNENAAAMRGWGVSYLRSSFSEWRAARDREQRQALEDEELRLRVEALRREAAQRDRPIGRPPKPLSQSAVLDAERELRKRAALAAEPRSGPLTYAAIARRVKLSRDRLRELEQLMALGWSLRESHPDFPAEHGEVRLPTPRQAARLRRLR